MARGRAGGRRGSLFGVDEFDAGFSSRVDAFIEPPAGTVLLTTASEPSRWRRLAGDCAVVEMRAGRVHDRPRAVNDQGARGTERSHAYS
jgi:hypothetical protein